MKILPIREWLALPQLLASILLAAGTGSFIAFEGAWGQEAASLIGYQSTGFGHGIILFNLATNWCTAMPAAYGLFAGLLTQRKCGWSAVCAALPLIVVMTIQVVELATRYAVVFSVIGALLMILLFGLGKLTRDHCLRTKLVEKAVACAAFYCLPSFCLLVVDPSSQITFRADTLLSLVGVFIANLLFVRFVRPSRVVQVVQSAVFVSFPLLCVNFFALIADFALILFSPRCNSAWATLALDGAMLTCIAIIAMFGAAAGFVSREPASAVGA